MRSLGACGHCSASGKVMARLQEVVLFLSKGYSLQRCDGRISFVPSKQGSRVAVTRHKQETRERLFRPSEHTLSEVRAMDDVFEYGVLFLSLEGREYRIDRLEDIEAAISSGVPHTVWGQLPR